VRSVLDAHSETLERRYWIKSQGVDFNQVAIRAAETIGLDPGEIKTGGKHPPRVKARSLTCYWAVKELGMTTVAVAQLLGISQPAVTKAVQRGEKLAIDNGFNLIA